MSMSLPLPRSAADAADDLDRIRQGVEAEGLGEGDDDDLQMGRCVSESADDLRQVTQGVGDREECAYKERGHFG